MKNSFNKFVDYFIHPQLKVDKSLHEKSIIYVLAFVIILGMGILYTVFYWSNGVIWDIKSFHNYTGVVLSITGLTIIKRTGKTMLALSMGAIVGTYLVTASVFLSGGINSNDLLWYTVLSAACFMFISTRIGFTVAGISTICITLFYTLDSFNIMHFSSSLVSLSLGYRYFNFVLILGVLTLMVYVLVSGNNKLQQVIQLNKEQKMREEIARDFHDQIGNKLASLRHLAELIKMKKDSSEQDQIVSKIDENAKNVYDNFRDFIWTLDAKSDQLIELFMYLRDFADDYFKFSDVNLYITSTPDTLPEIMLPSYYSKEIVPIFKEAITNVYKHAQSKNVYLNFIISKTTLTIKLIDDGKGMDSELLKKGNGLTNMKHRAEKTGGKFDIRSSKEGTEVEYSVLLPIKGS